MIKSLIAIAAVIPIVAGAATDQDLAQIRESIKRLEQRHAEDQARIEDLERRLKQAESKLPAAGTAAPAPPPTAGVEKEPEPPPAAKALMPIVGPTGNITFTPGMRIQGRYSYDTGGGKPDVFPNHDFFIRRFRLKARGDAFGLAKYLGEIRIDNVGLKSPDSSALVENAWLDFPILPDLALLVGQYDLPFSRNVLTSDSKLLLMDRSLISGKLTTLGLADNTIGVLAHGRPFGGHFGYAVGIFDNIGSLNSNSTLESQKVGMSAGRLEFDFLDPAPAGGYADYRGSYIGQGQRLSIGLNAAYLPNARDKSKNEFDLYGWGGDLFFNKGPFTLAGEYDRFKQDMSGASPDVDGHGWYVQAGYLFHPLFELAARYQELDPDENVSNDSLRWTSVGFNTYLREHYLKIQTDYTFKSEPDNDLLQVQLQWDY